MLTLWKKQLCMCILLFYAERATRRATRRVGLIRREIPSNTHYKIHHEDLLWLPSGTKWTAFVMIWVSGDRSHPKFVAFVTPSTCCMTAKIIGHPSPYGKYCLRRPKIVPTHPSDKRWMLRVELPHLLHRHDMFAEKDDWVLRRDVLVATRDRLLECNWCRPAPNHNDGT